MALVTRRETSRGFSLTETGGNTLTNSTVETSLFSYVIPAGKMGTSKILKFEIICHITTPALSIPSLTIKIKLGAAVLTIVSTATLGAAIADKPIKIEGTIANLSATNAQFVYAQLTSASGSGLIFSLLSASTVVTDAAWTVDTTLDQTFAVTGQFGGLSGTTSITPKLVSIDLS